MKSMIDADVVRETTRQLRESLRGSIAKAVPLPKTPEDIAHLRDAAIDLMLDGVEAKGEVLLLSTRYADAVGAAFEEKARADDAEGEAERHRKTVDRMSQDNEIMDEALRGAGYQGMPRFEAVQNVCAEVVLLREQSTSAQREADQLRASKETERSRSKSQLQRLNEQIHVLRLTNEDLSRVNHEHVATIRELKDRLADALPDDRHSVIEDEDKPTITIPEPRVPYPGGRAQSEYMRTAAARFETSRLFGSNVTATVVKLLVDVAEALEAKVEQAAAKKEPSDG